MAIQFLTGLNIDGDIDLNSNQLKEVRIDNIGSAQLVPWEESIMIPHQINLDFIMGDGLILIQEQMVTLHMNYLV